MRSFCALSRRHILSGTLAASCLTVAGARAETTVPNSAGRVLRVMPKASPPPGGDAGPAGQALSGYDGVVPGPLLRVQRGKELNLCIVNGLPEPTAIHWHGVRLANAMDGAPPLTQAVIAAGDSFACRFTTPDAGTYWYHPPAPAIRGLYGVLIVDETEPVEIDRDVVLIFDSWQCADTGSATPDRPDHFAVNGAASWDIRVRANARLRLRLINASGSNMLPLRIANLRAFVMAIDGQQAEPFVPRDGRLLLGPGNRVDVFIDCALARGASAAILVDAASGSIPAVHITCEDDQPSRVAPLPDPHPLPPNALPERMDFRGAFRLDAAIDGGTIHNGGRPLFAVKRGRTVMLGLSNPTSENRCIHLHGHCFRLLDSLDDGWKPFWLDTIPITPQGTTRIAFVADNPGKWLLEGLDRRDGALPWFDVS